MTDTDHAKAAKFWDKSARKYAESKIADPAEYENGIEITQTFLKPEHHVLEMGCGTGMTALALAPNVARFTGTDVSPEMIAICNERRAAAGVDNVEFKVASTASTDWVADQYDVVLAFNLLHLVDDLDSTLANANRVLKPGGIFISKTPCLNETWLFSLMRWPLKLAVLAGQAPPVSFFKTQQLDQRVKSAGFSLVHVYTTEKSLRRHFIAAKKTT